ncbi:MAG TPA: hypothetical protein VM537_29855 [Anaerolineae bacterium]|nr:hypothetical protein [Anaerolineae bacterium]
MEEWNEVGEEEPWITDEEEKALRMAIRLGMTYLTEANVQTVLHWARETRENAHHLDQAIAGKEILFVDGQLVGFFVPRLNA